MICEKSCMIAIKAWITSWLKVGTDAKYNLILAQAFSDWMSTEWIGKSIKVWEGLHDLYIITDEYENFII